jgi:hypothetical protein
MIDTIVTWGYPPDFPMPNHNTEDIKNRMRFLNEAIDSRINYDLYTKFFTTIAHIIEKNVKIHHGIIFQHFYKPHEYITQKSWPLPVTYQQVRTQGGVIKKTKQHFVILSISREVNVTVTFKKRHFR